MLQWLVATKIVKEKNYEIARQLGELDEYVFKEQIESNQHCHDVRTI
jgi:hypothetical protein